MKLLALETTQACSVALLDGDRVTERNDTAPRGATQRVLPMVRSLLADSGTGIGELDAVAFGRGPGGFTGLRIAAGVAQGLALGAALPVVPVSSLSAFAQGAYRRHGCRRILVCLDARLGEVYWCAFTISDDGLAQPVGEEALSVPEAVRLDAGGGWFAAGSAWQAFPLLGERLADSLEGRDTKALPSAVDVAHLAAAGFPANAVEPEMAQPVYLRNEVAWRRPPAANNNS